MIPNSWAASGRCTLITVPRSSRTNDSPFLRAVDRLVAGAVRRPWNVACTLPYPTLHKAFNLVHSSQRQQLDIFVYYISMAAIMFVKPGKLILRGRFYIYIWGGQLKVGWRCTWEKRMQGGCMHCNTCHIALITRAPAESWAMHDVRVKRAWIYTPRILYYTVYTPGFSTKPDTPQRRCDVVLHGCWGETHRF